MKINYDDLVTYLDQSEDWHQLKAIPGELTYIGPNDAHGDPAQIVLDPSNPILSIQTLTEIAIGILAAIEDISTDDMANRITLLSVKALMDAIKFFDCEPSVFYVNLIAADHRAGYTAAVDFRTTYHSAASSVQAHGDTPKEALTRLLAVLKAKWGRCPHCGQHLDGKDHDDA